MLSIADTSRTGQLTHTHAKRAIVFVSSASKLHNSITFKMIKTKKLTTQMMALNFN